MIDSFLISPYVTAYSGAICYTFMMLSYVWWSGGYSPNYSAIGYVEQGTRTVLRVLYGFVGLLCLDASILWLFGSWGYADWRFQLPSVIIGLIIGVEYLGDTLFVKPNRVPVLFLGILAGVAELYVIHVYIPSLTNIYWGLTVIFIVPVITAVIFLVGGALVSIYRRKHESIGDRPPLWDFSTKYDKIFTKRVDILLWIICMLEAMLKFGGTSLFIW